MDVMKRQDGWWRIENWAGSVAEGIPWPKRGMIQRRWTYAQGLGDAFPVRPTCNCYVPATFGHRPSCLPWPRRDALPSTWLPSECLCLGRRVSTKSDCGCCSHGRSESFPSQRDAYTKCSGSTRTRNQCPARYDKHPSFLSIPSFGPKRRRGVDVCMSRRANHSRKKIRVWSKLEAWPYDGCRCKFSLSWSSHFPSLSKVRTHQQDQQWASTAQAETQVGKARWMALSNRNNDLGSLAIAQCTAVLVNRSEERGARSRRSHFLVADSPCRSPMSFTFARPLPPWLSWRMSTLHESETQRRQDAILSLAARSLLRQRNQI